MGGNYCPPGFVRGRLRPEELEQIAELGERLNAGQIALRLNRHPATVGYAMHRLHLRTLAPRSFDYMRNGVRVKSFSPEEDAMIVEMRVAGAGLEAIAQAITERFGHPRSPHTINTRLVLLSNAEEEPA